MASLPSSSAQLQDADGLQAMAAQLLGILSATGDGERRGRKAWDELQQKLAEISTYVANPEFTVDSLLQLLQDGMGPSSFLSLGHPEAEALLGKITTFLKEETSRAAMPIPQLRELLLVVAGQLEMLPLRDSEPVHMVDGDSNFCEENVDIIVKSSPQLSAPNAPYAVVSIVGAQSSGKSYLLNRLFGTKFPEMDAIRGRSQTTRGIMISRCIGPSMLVLDVEGFDGREKGQDTLFENQTALLALSISDIILVNMNVFDIGREQASGTLLFKTIFKERTKLPAGLTKILVVLRMYNGETPLETLRDDVTKRLEKTWRSVNMQSLKFEDYIKVNVIGLPDKNSKGFGRQVTILRKLLSKSPIDQNRSAKGPASSFSVSSAILWDDIKKNRKLDIPSHQVALARLYCRQTAKGALNSTYCGEEYKLLKAEESPPRFRKISDTLLKSIIAMYNQETEMYDPEERDKGRQYMVEKQKTVFIEDSRELIRKLRRNNSERFKEEYVQIAERMQETDGDLNYDDQIVDSCVENFLNSCEDLKVFDSDYIHRTCGELRKYLRSYIVYHSLPIKKTRKMKQIELARQNLTELVNRLEEMIKEKELAEAEMSRQNVEQLEEELEYARKMEAKDKEHTKDRNGALPAMRPDSEDGSRCATAAVGEGHACQEQTEKMLVAVQQADQMENMVLPVQQEQAENLVPEVQQDQTEKVLPLQPEQTEKIVATVQPEQTEKMTLVQHEQTEKMLVSVQQEQTEEMLVMQPEQTEEVVAGVQQEETEKPSIKECNQM